MFTDSYIIVVKVIFSKYFNEIRKNLKEDSYMDEFEKEIIKILNRPITTSKKFEIAIDNAFNKKLKSKKRKNKKMKHFS